MLWRLLRRNYEPGTTWTPLLFLCYLGFVFLAPIQQHASWKGWAVTIAAVLCFLALYLTAYFRKDELGRWSVLAILVLACAFAPFNPGAFGFFIYAAGLIGFRLEFKTAHFAVAALLAAVAIEGWVLQPGFWLWAYILPIAAIVGFSNIHLAAKKRADAKLRLAHEEIEHLAKVAERERIARDLHDVLGHTLSVVVLKSELAAKLVDLDGDRARKEMGEVEQIAREALADVRHAIRGYRARGFGEELAQARATLEMAGVRAECETPDMQTLAGKMSASQETVLALVVRESVTNVVRHARAQVCRICLERGASNYHLEIADDGRGGFDQEGNGLRGMRERVEALNGTMLRDTSRGTRLTVTIPLRSKHEAIA